MLILYGSRIISGLKVPMKGLDCSNRCSAVAIFHSPDLQKQETAPERQS